MIFAAIGVAIYLIVIILVVAPVVRYLLLRCSRSCTVDLDAKTLFITAHPDDECMFFAPSVLTLTTHNRENAFLLCLSEGKCKRQELYFFPRSIHAPSDLGPRSGNYYYFDSCLQLDR